MTDRPRLDARSAGAMSALLAVVLLALTPAVGSARPAPTGGLQEQETDTAGQAADTLAPSDTMAEPEREDPSDTIRGSGEGPAVVPGTTTGLAESLDRLRTALQRVGEEAVRATRSLALVVHDDYTITRDQLVAGNVAVLGGTLEVLGSVEGDLMVLDGRVTLAPSSRIAGDVVQVGGQLQQSGGQIGGQIVSVGAAPSVERRAAPVRVRQESDDDDDDGLAFIQRYRPDANPFWDLWRNVGSGIAGLFTTAGFFLLFAFLGIVTIYLVPDKFHVTADTARHNFGRSFLVGLAGQFLFLPAIVALGLGIITAVLIPFFILAVCLAHLVGYLAAAQATGEALALRDPPWRERLPFSGRYEHLLTGLLVLLALYLACSVLEVFGGIFDFFQALAVLGAITVTWVATTAGFGAALLSRAGTRREWALPRRSTGEAGAPEGAQPAAGGGPAGPDGDEAAEPRGETTPEEDLDA